MKSLMQNQYQVIVLIGMQTRALCGEDTIAYSNYSLISSILKCGYYNRKTEKNFRSY